ncbi:unnamed protein product [Linum tenue]|uniref:Prenyltransferase alpha-alpha toroid domain-containing protein n=1 Tax=Linum tenue TaxID=586396 RepID=A0AAV0M9A4_9ROSI|nr:unnamed protein product [Linum tenue]
MAEQPLDLDSSPSTPGEQEEGEQEECIGKLLADSSFERERHLMFLQMMYQMLPHHYQSQEINRLTLAYFAISGLDIVGSLDTVDKDEVASWVLSFRAYPEDIAEINDGEFYGFNGSRSSQYHSDDAGGFSNNHSHLASTYCALAILKIVGYHLTSIDWRPLLMTMRNLQQPDGRQASDGGFQGRSNKPSDTCYAFWVGAVLKILGAGKLIDYGGFSKFPDELPDLYHSYYGFIAFSLLEEPGLNSICVELGITEAAASALRK